MIISLEAYKPGKFIGNAALSKASNDLGSLGAYSMLSTILGLKMQEV